MTRWVYLTDIRPFRGSARRFFSGAAAVAVFCTLAGMPPALAVQDAASLRAHHVALRAQLANNQFQRPLYLVSSEDSGELKGDIYALIDQPYAVVGPALQGMDRWCDILILHLNVKSCRASTPRAGDTLSLNIGRKFDQPLTDEYLFEFLYTVTVVNPDYLQVVLNAEQGPLGTSRYRVVLEVVALDANHSFLHLSYTYAYGTMARVAAQGYLATIGRNKVGFSIVSRKANGQPVYIRSVRGVIERNTMRYYLAIEAYLGALSVPASERLEKRLNDWFAGIERYPVQLHELERDEYLHMKRKEIRRQQAPGLASAARSVR
jgi:hypothetical protein